MVWLHHRLQNVASELPDGNARLEEAIDVLECSPRHIGNEEEGEDERQGRDGAKDETDLGPEGGVRLVEEIR